MELEKQVASLELSKKLKELGVRQKSLYFWCEKRERKGGEITGHTLYPQETAQNRMYNSPDLKTYSAFTVAELGEMLPDNLVSSGMDSGKWDCIYGAREDGNDMPNSKWENPEKYEFGYILFTDDTEAIVRAKMLIYLIENKFVNPKLAI